MHLESSQAAAHLEALRRGPGVTICLFGVGWGHSERVTAPDLVAEPPGVRLPALVLPARKTWTKPLPETPSSFMNGIHNCQSSRAVVSTK